MGILIGAALGVIIAVSMSATILHLYITTSTRKK